MKPNPIAQLTEWIVRDARQRPECRQYDITELDHLSNKYLQRTDWLAGAPAALLRAADEQMCGALRRQHPDLFSEMRAAA